MKEITFTQNSQLGMIKGVLRIIGKILFFKFNNNQYAERIIEQMKQRGAIIDFGKNKEWIRVDIFRDLELIKLGDKELDLKESSEEEIERFIADFYIEQYKKANFIVEEK